VLLSCVPLGPLPWLHRLRTQSPRFVRRLHCRGTPTGPTHGPFISGRGVEVWFLLAGIASTTAAALIGALIQTGSTHCHKVMGDDAPANVSARSFTAWGNPCSQPRYPPRASCASRSSACFSRVSQSWRGDDTIHRGVDPVDVVKKGVHHLSRQETSFALIPLERATASISKSSDVLAVGIAAKTSLLRVGPAAIAPVTKLAFFQRGSRR
jgi:hypothetical protein